MTIFKSISVDGQTYLPPKHSCLVFTYSKGQTHSHLPAYTHPHTCSPMHTCATCKQIHTHLYDVQASEILLPRPELPSPPWYTFVQSPRENPFPLHQVLSTQCYNIARMTNTYFFSFFLKNMFLYLEDKFLEIWRQTIHEYTEICWRPQQRN